MNSMTHRERVRAALEGRPTDRIPIAMICSGINEPVRSLLDRHLRDTRGVGLADYLDPLIDVRSLHPPLRSPLAPGWDYWGVHRSSVAHPNGGSYDEIDHYPLAAAQSLRELLAHPWPSTALFDYNAFAAKAAEYRRHGDLCLIAGNGNIFETAWYMRGMENLFLDFIENPEFAHTLLGRVADFYMDHFRNMFEAAPGEIDLAFTADDLGGQNGLLLSLDMWETFIKPHHRRLNRLLHDYGAKVVYHTDGAVMEAVPGLVEMGIDVLQALQFDAKGMDPRLLKEGYGDRLGFAGGVSVQSTLPFGTADEVAAEVRERIRVLGKGGNYILGPSHAIQAGTPVENVLSLFDTAAASGRG